MANNPKDLKLSRCECNNMKHLLVQFFPKLFKAPKEVYWIFMGRRGVGFSKLIIMQTYNLSNKNLSNGQFGDFTAMYLS